MDECEIEEQAEREMDDLDYMLLNGYLSQEEYDKKTRELNEWVNEQLHMLRNPNCKF